MLDEKDFSKRIVMAIVILNTLFTIAVFYVFLKIGNEPIALISAWFGFTTGELWLMASIKKTKVKEEGLEYENQLETEIVEP